MKSLKRKKIKKIDLSARKQRINDLLLKCKEFVETTDLRTKRDGRTIVKKYRQGISIQLRLLGYSYDEISKLLNVSKQTSYYDVRDELKQQRELNKETIEDVRQYEIERLDMILKKLFDSFDKGLIMRDEKGNILFDHNDKPIFTLDHKSIDQILKIMTRRSKLMGLDSPSQFSIEDNRPIRTDDNDRLLSILSRYLPNNKKDESKTNQTLH